MNSVRVLGLLKILSWNLRVSFSKKMKSHTVFYTICCFSFFPDCCQRMQGWISALRRECWVPLMQTWGQVRECSLISFSSVLYPNVFIIQWENHFLCIQLPKFYWKLCAGFQAECEVGWWRQMLKMKLAWFLSPRSSPPYNKINETETITHSGCSMIA